MEVLPFLGDQILSFFLSLLKEKTRSFLSQHENEIPEIKTKLDNIQNMQEMQLAMWLKAGLTHLQIGEIREARDEFIRAEASDKRSATAKLYLAMILAQTGKLDLAMEKLREAITINPFIVILSLPDNLTLPDSVGKIVEIMPQTWSCQLNSTRFTKNLSDGNSILSRLFPSGSQGTIHNISFSGGLLVFSLRLHNSSMIFDKLFWGGPDPRDTDFGERTLVCFDPNTGKLKWSVATPNKELVFATPTYVVLKTEKATYDFYETPNGIYSSTMGQEYFESVFFPSFASISKHKEYLRSNIKFLSENYILGDYVNQYKTRLTDEMEYNREDSHRIEPPFLTKNMGIQFIGRNQWSMGHINLSANVAIGNFAIPGSYGVPQSLKAMFCNAMLSCSSI
jgi:hypothetical protein